MSGDETKINRYDHGGARIFIERADGSRDLVADLYDDENGERRERIIAALIDAGVIEPRGAPSERDPWERLIKLAREIDPTLPADLSAFELRITFNREFQSIELVSLQP